MRQSRDLPRRLNLHRRNRGQIIHHIGGVLVHGPIRSNQSRQGGILVLLYYFWVRHCTRGHGAGWVTYDFDEFGVEVLAVQETDVLDLNFIGEIELSPEK